MGYQGTTARIPFGSVGIISDAAPTELSPTALLRAGNVTLLNGTVQKAPGARRLNATPLPAGVTALFDWRPDINTQKLAAACKDGGIYFDYGNGTFDNNTPLVTGLTNLTENSKFVTGGQETGNRKKKLFFFSFGENQIKVLSSDETTFANIAMPAVDWASGNYPRIGVLHRNSLWVFSNQISYASDTGNHENFQTNTLVNPVFPGEGDAIRGAYVFKGALFCFKDGGFTYVLNDEDPDSQNWYWQKLANNFGLSAPNAVTDVLDDMIAGNSSGTITSYTATNALGDVTSGDVFRAAGCENFLRQNTHPAGVPTQHILYYAAKKLLYITYRTGYFTYNNLLVCVDFSRAGAPPRVTFQPKGTPQCLAQRKDVNQIDRPIYGDKDGYVYFMDSPDRAEGPSAYTGEFQTIHFDMSHMGQELAGVNKHFDWLKVEYKPEGAWTLSCDYYIDGKFIETITFPMIQYDRPQLDILLLDTDRMVQYNTESYRKVLRGTGRVISFRFYNSGLKESFQVSGIQIGFRPSGEQAQRT